jgi:hypothetical protein
MSRSLYGQVRLHLHRNHPKDGGECTSLISVITIAVLNGVPKSRNLEVHLHYKRPFGVVRMRESRVDDVDQRLLDDALNDVVIIAAMARVVRW